MPLIAGNCVMDADRLLPGKVGSPSYQYGGNQMAIPNEDIHENASQVQPVPTAPPIT